MTIRMRKSWSYKGNNEVLEPRSEEVGENIEFLDDAIYCWQRFDNMLR